MKYITEIKGVDLLKTGNVQKAYLVGDLEITDVLQAQQIHPEIMRQVNEWRRKQTNNQYWENPLHC